MIDSWCLYMYMLKPSCIASAALMNCQRFESMKMSFSHENRPHNTLSLQKEPFTYLFHPVFCGMQMLALNGEYICPPKCKLYIMVPKTPNTPCWIYRQ